MYLSLVVGAGTAILVDSAFELIQNPVDMRWYVLAGLTIVSGLWRLTIESLPVSTSTSDTFTITAALIFGPAAGTAIAAVDAVAMSLRLRPQHRSMRRLLFNVTALAVAIWVPTKVFFLLAGSRGFSIEGAANLGLLGALAVFACLYFIMNTGLVAIAIAIEHRASVITIWREHFLGLWLTYFAGTSVAGALAFLWRTRNLDLATLAVLIPLPLVLYFMFKHALGRNHDQIAHLGEINRLYLATIEALAHAIDAKDQVTHGHIRRVQRHAVRLAEELGIRADREIKAIEAASLLHDMGKLAVPEHILNKPGRLTPAEFEIMKRHAPVGADILSAIDFPYPVVPIVRHHHENWDGTGYPDGLAGEQIPIGARILSIVDCFDALTSDRPYRPRMTTDEAMAILQQRRGTMYDPRIVDIFKNIHAEFDTESPSTRLSRETLAMISDPTAARPAPADHDDDETKRLRAALDLGRALADADDANEVAIILQQHLQTEMPLAVLAIYVYDDLSDTLVLRDATGNQMRALAGLRVRLGDGVSGWVAANRQPMINADPRLELQEHAAQFSPALRSCLAVPLAGKGDAVIGVIAAYASTPDAFREAHRRLLEAVASRVALLVGPPPKPPLAAQLVSAQNTVTQNRTS
jgi:putative nucleotidyltransferase with HDIG domain